MHEVAPGTSPSLPTVLLKPGDADRVVAGHPWIYEGAILRVTQAIADGEVVQVKDHRQRLLGTGVFNSKSKIHVRLLSPEREDLDQDFFERRIRAAVAVRERHMPGTTCRRVVNAESDRLSGVIVDQYGDVLVLQISSLGMDLRKALIVAALQKVLKPRAIIERSDAGSRKFEGLTESSGLLAGEPVERIEATVGAIKYDIDLKGGHKTGIYLDQQLNHLAVAKFAKDAAVLDCFSFLGGFALHAAQAGARHVLGLDQSEDAVAAARANAQRHGLASCEFEAANVFDWLKSHTSVAPNERLLPKFDLIILDPPSFTRNRAAVEDALRGYKEIHLRALKLLKPNGVLATFCCSHHVDSRLFEDVILSAAFDTHKVLRRVATYSQSPDHPVVPSIPETEYLKGYAYEVLS
ncbi:MAG TPA: class I SAM-dependent rRNA methyltransferase [Candidatus Limnocylindria bacterium]|nr:class I SAM-dependent rRNA methyltransferase [Candidatus Limnocylindria bacterium]